MFTGNNHRDFYNYFQNESDCKYYLFELKWDKGYRCRKCGFDKYWSGITSFHTRCRVCDFNESVTCCTAFHKIKFPLLTAFGIAFQLVVLKKGRSSLDLAREFAVQPATVRLFRQKIHAALESAFERSEEDLYGQPLVMDSVALLRGSKLLNGFQRTNLMISSSKTKNKKDQTWQCKVSVPDNESLSISQLVAGKFMEENSSLMVWNLKTWLTGSLHHCSTGKMQGYVNESFFRLNYRMKIPLIWHTLITILVKGNP